MYIQHARYGRPSSEVSSHYFKRESTPITGHASYRESKSGDSAVMKRWNGLQFELIPRPEVVCMIVRIVISHQLIIWLKTPNRHHPHCRPSCRRHSDALLSVTAFQSRHLLHWPWFCFIGYLSITILIIRVHSFITVNVVSSNARFMSNVRHQPPYLVLEPPYPHLSPEPLPPRDLWSYLFNDETWLEHKYSKKKFPRMSNS